ncbi:MAG: S9 family peptidase [Gemmatimonadetes bacterium]|nr:S9 family peptidase [Gemmatimonadota bacterium]
MNGNVEVNFMRCAAVMVAVAVAPLAAQRPMTADDVLKIKQVSDAQISPDGRWVAYVVGSVDLAQNAVNTDIWLVATSGGEPIRLTSHPKADGEPRWSPDGKWIAFVSAREDRPQVWGIRPGGGEPERWTESKTPVQSFQWSPDGSKLAFVALRELTAEEERKEKEKDDAELVDRNFRMSWLWLFDLATKKSAELVKGDFTVSEPRFSPDGTRLAFVSRPTPKADDGSLSDIHVVTIATGAVRRLIDNRGPDNSPRWSPDGRWIAYSSRGDSLRAFGQQQLMIVAAEGGAPRPVTRSFLYQPGPVTWSADGHTLYFSAGVRTTIQYFSVPASGGEPKQLSTGAGVLGTVSTSADGRMAAATFTDVQHPNDVFAIRSVAPWQVAKLTDHNPELAGIARGRSEVIKWKSRDGMEIEGVVVYPIGYQPNGGRRWPTMAFIHGGPAGAWLEDFPGRWGHYAHVYAGQGWLSFYPNVRGSSNYGERFLRANVRDWGGGDYQDIQTGLDHLIRLGVSDSTRLGQAGWSYGGYMTAWTLTQTNRFKGVMVGAGLTNMFSMYSTNDLQTTLENYFGAEPWDDEAAYRRASAMTFIKQAKTPTLILHGQQDLRVPIGQAQELYMGLKKNEVPVTLVFYPRAGHGLTEPRHQLDKMKREYAFFSKTVLGIEVKEKPELTP